MGEMTDQAKSKLGEVKGQAEKVMDSAGQRMGKSGEDIKKG